MEDHVLDNIQLCECGKKHTLETEVVKVCDNAFDMLLEFLQSPKYSKILIISNKALDCYSDKIFSLESQNKHIEIVLIPSCKATIEMANTIVYHGEDLVVAIGGEELISVCKYYAFCENVPLVIFPIGNFTDFTFSSFSRMFDGAMFNFYFTKEPIAIFVSLSQNKLNNYQTYYISSKFIALFDNIVSECVYENHSCQRMIDFFYQTLNNYISNRNYSNINIRNIWTLIRLGQAMTFFGETKYFFGGDKPVCDLLQCKCAEGDFLELESVALKLVINSYACFLKNPLNKNVVDLNKHILITQRLLKIPSTEVIKRMCDSKLLSLQENVERNLNNFHPYLKRQFEKIMSKVFKIQTTFCLSENVLLKNKFTHEKVQNCFAIAPNFYSRPTLLHLIESYGFMDKLFE